MQCKCVADKANWTQMYPWAHFFLMLSTFHYFSYQIIFAHFPPVANASFYDGRRSASPEAARGLTQLCSLTLRNCKQMCKISRALCDQLWFSCKTLECGTMRLAALKSNYWNFTSKHQLWLHAAWFMPSVWRQPESCRGMARTATQLNAGSQVSVNSCYYLKWSDRLKLVPVPPALNLSVSVLWPRILPIYEGSEELWEESFQQDT